jgi:hypothetical protein
MINAKTAKRRRKGKGEFRFEAMTMIPSQWLRLSFADFALKSIAP